MGTISDVTGKVVLNFPWIKNIKMILGFIMLIKTIYDKIQPIIQNFLKQKQNNNEAPTSGTTQSNTGTTQSNTGQTNENMKIKKFNKFNESLTVDMPQSVRTKFLYYIKQCIDLSKKNQPQMDLSKLIYNIIIRSNFEDYNVPDLQSYYDSKIPKDVKEFLNKNKTNWYNHLNKIKDNSDPEEVWRGFDINRTKEKRTNYNTYNFYYTLELTAENLKNFINNIHILKYDLQVFSEKNGKIPLAFKTMARLDDLINQKDHLKVYYYDSKYKEELRKVIKDWFTKSNIKTTQRKYEDGMDSTRGTKKDSWGSNLSEKMAEEFKKLIEQHKDKFTPEDYLNWLIKMYQNTKFNSIE